MDYLLHFNFPKSLEQSPLQEAVKEFLVKE